MSSGSFSGAGSFGGSPSSVVRPVAWSRSAKDATTRTVSLPWQTRVASPVAIRRPTRAIRVCTSAGPTTPGRR